MSITKPHFEIRLIHSKKCCNVNECLDCAAHTVQMFSTVSLRIVTPDSRSTILFNMTTMKNVCSKTLLGQNFIPHCCCGSYTSLLRLHTSTLKFPSHHICHYHMTIPRNSCRENLPSFPMTSLQSAIIDDVIP